MILQKGFVNRMSEELKACPFCGRKPEIRHNADGFSYVLCANDGCYARTDGCLNDNEAAKAWNRRAEPGNKPLTAQWISAKDKLPEIGQRVVVKCNELYHGMFDVLCYYPDYKPWKNDGVAYWLPLPELPENTRNPEGSCSMA